MKLTITAIAIGLTVGFCSPTYADDNLWRDPYRDTLAEQRDAERDRLSEERRQFEWAESDMQRRRERYESERRREVRENDHYFNWGSSWEKKEQRRTR